MKRPTFGENSGGLMLGLIGLAINGFAAIRLWGSGLGTIAVISTVASIWSWGVMMNFQDNPTAAPNWSANLNMISMLAGVILLVVSFF